MNPSPAPSVSTMAAGCTGAKVIRPLDSTHAPSMPRVSTTVSGPCAAHQRSSASHSPASRPGAERKAMSTWRMVAATPGRSQCSE